MYVCMHACMYVYIFELYDAFQASSTPEVFRGPNIDLVLSTRHQSPWLQGRSSIAKTGPKYMAIYSLKPGDWKPQKKKIIITNWNGETCWLIMKTGETCWFNLGLNQQLYNCSMDIPQWDNTWPTMHCLGVSEPQWRLNSWCTVPYFQTKPGPKRAKIQDPKAGVSVHEYAFIEYTTGTR